MKVMMLSAMVFKDNSTVCPRQIVTFEDEAYGQILIDNNLAILIAKTEVPKEEVETEEKPKTTRTRRTRNKEEKVTE